MSFARKFIAQALYQANLMLAKLHHSRFAPPEHVNCRCIMVPIKEEKESD